MAARRRGKLLAGFGALLGIWTGSSGCQSVNVPWVHSPVQEAAAPAQFRGQSPGTQARDVRLVSAPGQTLAARMECQWVVEANQIQPNHRMAGTGIVGPDGTLEIGPYGSVHVAGLTPDQARQAVRKHLANYLANPRVTLAPVVSGVQTVAFESAPPAPAPQENPNGSSSWRPAQHLAEGNAASAWQTTSSGSRIRLASAPLPVSAPVTTETAPPPQAIEVDAAPPMQGEVVAPPRHRFFHPHKEAAYVSPPEVPRELAKVTLPTYVIEPPDILLVEVSGIPRLEQQVAGQHLVRPDGTIGLGVYGSVRVAGMTLDQIREAVVQQLKPEFTEITLKKVNVDVLAYNSKWYYIVADGAGYGEQLFRLPITGNETVLDGMSLIGGLPAVSSKYHIWVARRTPGSFDAEKILPVDWIGITQHGRTMTNYQIMPGDRIYVKADKWRTFDASVGKVLSPFERMLGITLLGSETVNSIRGVSTSAP